MIIELNKSINAFHIHAKKFSNLFISEYWNNPLLCTPPFTSLYSYTASCNLTVPAITVTTWNHRYAQVTSTCSAAINKLLGRSSYQTFVRRSASPTQPGLSFIMRSSDLYRFWTRYSADHMNVPYGPLLAFPWTINGECLWSFCLCFFRLIHRTFRCCWKFSTSTFVLCFTYKYDFVSPYKTLFIEFMLR